MNNYQEMYYILFNAITEATKILEEAQKKVEEIYLSSDEQQQKADLNGPLLILFSYQIIFVAVLPI